MANQLNNGAKVERLVLGGVAGCENSLMNSGELKSSQLIVLLLLESFLHLVDFKVVRVVGLQLRFFNRDGWFVFPVQELKVIHLFVNLALFSLNYNKIWLQLIHLVLLMLFLQIFFNLRSEIDFIFELQTLLLKLAGLGCLLNSLLVFSSDVILFYHLLRNGFLLFDLLLHFLDCIFVLFQVLFMVFVEFAG